MESQSRAIQHSEGTFEGVDRLKLYTQSWILEGATNKAILVIVHGLKDHSSRYGALVEAMVRRGFAIYAFDLRGHGKSEGKRAYVKKFDNLVEDLEIFMKDLRQKNPKLPIFVFAHSMGGTAVVLSVVTQRIQFKGVILSAAALAPGAGISPFLISVTRLLGALFPGLALMNLPNRDFSRDPQVVAGMSSDPLILQKNGPVRTAAQLLNGMRQIQPSLAKFSAPVLILHGAADKLTNPAGSRKLFDAAISRDKTLKLYPELVHDLVHEPEKAQVIADITAWLEARTFIAP